MAIGGVGQDLHHAHAAHTDHDLEGAGVKEVPDKHAGRVAELGVGGLAAAPQLGFVDDVVVQQGGRVDELDHRRELDVLLAAVPRRAGARNTNAGRRRFPPPAMMYSAIWRMSTHPTPAGAGSWRRRLHVCGNQIAEELGLHGTRRKNERAAGRGE